MPENLDDSDEEDDDILDELGILIAQGLAPGFGGAINDSDDNE